MEFRLAEAKLHHCGQMARRLRSPQAQAMASIGLRSHAELRQRFTESAFKRSWLIDGKLAAIGGVTGSWISSEGLVWLALSEDCARHPRQTALTARAQLAEMLETRSQVFTLMFPSDPVSMRWVKFLGFEAAAGETPDGTILMRRRSDG